MLQPQLLKEILAFLDYNHIDYMVTGSTVSSLQGRANTIKTMNSVRFRHQLPLLSELYINLFCGEGWVINGPEPGVVSLKSCNFYCNCAVC